MNQSNVQTARHGPSATVGRDGAPNALVARKPTVVIMEISEEEGALWDAELRRRERP